MERLKQILTSKQLTVVAAFLGLYLVSSGVSLAGFSLLSGKMINPTTTGSQNKNSRIDLSKPKTEACPLNGAYFTKEEKTNWSTKRPIVAMIENSLDARPQSGLSKADIIYEAVAEGGITRFMPVFYCNTASEEVKIAPVRSARIYFVNLAMEYGNKPIFMHVGGANNYSGSGDTVKEARALEYLESIGWRVPRGNDFDTTYDSAYPVFWRNYERLGREVATEHTMMASLDAAYEQAKKRGLEYEDSKGIAWDKSFRKWLFADDKKVSSPKYAQISYGFWDNKPDFNVTWKYDSATNSYLRYTGGLEHKDLESDSILNAKNVVVVFATEKGPVDRNMHMLYTVTGKGSALIFQNGDVIEATWDKASGSDRMIFKDSSGKEISFVRGQIWVSVVPDGNIVDY